jgi:diamine N-acetyltransferase
MNIRICVTKDTRLLAKLNHDVQEIHNTIEPEIFKPYSEDNMKNLFDYLLKDENRSAFVAYDDDCAVGYILIAQRDYPENDFKKNYSVIYIDQICVESDYKGKGAGKALIDFAKKYATEKHVSRVELDYWNANKNAGEFIRSQGFSTYNERMFIKL